ncbi:MAG: hypothetical protein HYV07_21590 [Deltaproteobacteria bacterium]|nr:hypothetical protein [Deltaproteobacteria bacterium]
MSIAARDAIDHLAELRARGAQLEAIRGAELQLLDCDLSGFQTLAEVLEAVREAEVALTTDRKDQHDDNRP